MPSIGTLDIVQMNLRVPRGYDGYWKLILELDKVGPWAISQLVLRSNVSTRSISQFVDMLRKAGIAIVVDERVSRPGQRNPAAVYRLTARPLETPRLHKDGTALPEPDREILWRTMKMAKAFTPRELHQLASTAEHPIGLEFTRQYVSRLYAAGVIAQVNPVKSLREGRYRLVRNLGARAPKVLATRVVFDPNSKTVIGDGTAVEVSR